MTAYLIRQCLNILRSPWDLVLLSLGVVVLSSAIGPIASTISSCNFTINEWADAGSNVDYIELKNHQL